MANKKSTFLHNLGINKKFSYSLLLIIIIPTLILMFVMNHFYSKYLLEKNGEFQLAKLKQAETSVCYLLDNIDDISKEVLSSDSIHNLLKDSPKEREKGLPECNYYIQSRMIKRDFISRISVHTSDKIFLQFGGFSEKEEKFPYKEAEEAEGSPFWYFLNNTDIYALPNQPYFCLGRAINDFYSFNKVIGYESIYVPEAFICEKYQDFVGKEGHEIMILDDAGTIISSNIKEHIGTKYSYFSDEIKTEKEGFLYSGKSSIVTFSSFSNNGWKIVSINNNVDGIAFKIINLILSISLILILVFFQLFLTIQRRTIINPLLKLKKELKSFADTQTINYPEIHYHDEIGELTKDFVEMEEKINNLIAQEYKSRISQQEAKLIALQSQINPHFLYNTLDSLRWTALTSGQKELAEQIQALSNLFKHALNNGKQETTVSEDLEHLKNYIKILKNRFGNRFQFEINTEKETLDLQTLKLILQPLVENSIYHGLEPKIDGGTVKVSIYKKDGYLIYYIEDDGVGTDLPVMEALEDTETKSGGLFALKNIQARIQYKFGKEYGLTFCSAAGEGCRVTVKLPVVNGEEESEIINS